MPRPIPQTASAAVEEPRASTPISKTPLFHEVEATKKRHHYQLSREVRDAICTDIGNFELERKN